MKRNLLEGFLEPGIVDWVIIIALGIGVIFLFYKFGMKTDETGRRKFSSLRFFIFMGLLLFLVYLIGDLLPENIKYGPVGDAIDWIKGLSWWVIGIAIIVLISLWWWGRRKEKRANYREGYSKKSGELAAEGRG